MKMEDVRRHISGIVEAVVEKFEAVTVRYQYLAASESHLIEITPKGKVESPRFQQFMNDTLSEFYELFPNESIIFISEDSLVEITTPEIVKTSVKKEVCPLTIITSNPAPGIPEGYVVLDEVPNWTVTLQDKDLTKRGDAGKLTINLVTSFTIADIELIQSSPKTQFVDVWTAGYTIEPTEDSHATLWISNLWRSKHRSMSPKDRPTLLTYATAA